MDNSVRKPMGKLYAKMDWLDFGQAVSWIAELSDTRRPHLVDMSRLCESGALSACMDLTERQVQILNDDPDAPLTYAIGKGLARVEAPLIQRDRDGEYSRAIGPVTLCRTGEDIEDARFRVRHSASHPAEFLFTREDIQRLANEAHPTQDKPIDVRERKSIEQIIAVLADMASVDLSSPHSTDEVLRHHAATKGLLLPASPETIKKQLKAAALRVESDRKAPPA